MRSGAIHKVFNTRSGTSLCLVRFLCIDFIAIQGSSTTFEIYKKKKNHLNSPGPGGGRTNPEVRSKRALPPPPAYLVNISSSPLLSIHVKLCLCASEPAAPRRNRLFLSAPLPPLLGLGSVFRAAAHNLSGINDVVNKMRMERGWICLAGLVPVLSPR